MCDLYLALPDKLLIWCYQNNLFSLKCFLSLLLLPFPSLSPFAFIFSLAPFPPLLPPFHPFAHALSLACTLSLFHFCLSSLFLSPRLSCLLALFTCPFFLALACPSCSCVISFSLLLYVVFFYITMIPVSWFSVYFEYISNCDDRNYYQIRYKLDLKSVVKIPVFCVVMMYRNGNFTKTISL